MVARYDLMVFFSRLAPSGVVAFLARGGSLAYLGFVAPGSLARSGSLGLAGLLKGEAVLERKKDDP
jgi:hypothetical protein